MKSLSALSSGRLRARSNLHKHLSNIVLPFAGINVAQPDFELHRLSIWQEVYLCKERNSSTPIVCKFFGSRSHLSKKKRLDLLNQEFGNLNAVREKGFCEFPYQVVRPLSKNEQINCLLVEEFARGNDLDYYLAKAAWEGQHEKLLKKLTMLAHFLAELHSRTALTARVNFADTADYFRHLVDSLARLELIDELAVGEFKCLCHEWTVIPEMWADISVLVHGDVTPTNFFFHPEDGLTAIDLERMHPADRVCDLGMLAAELKNHFAWRVFKADAAEPFITHFLRAYCDGVSDPESRFNAITYRNRFYMALGELRIARNIWLTLEHRKWLIDEARRCLQL